MRDILVHATQYAPWSHATEFAARLAALLRSGLTALWCVEPIPQVITADVAVIASKPHPEINKALACGELFSAWASSLGVRHSEWLACEDRSCDALAYVGQWHDLIVLGAGNGTPWGTESALADVLLASQRACLIVPESRLQSPRLDRVALAWDGSPSAMRALHAALPLLERSGRLVVLSGTSEAKAHAPLPMFDLDRWCDRHELRVERETFAPRTGATGGALLGAAMAANVDLLVLGAFGHSRLWERALGGVSRHVLAHSPVPLFMRH